MTKVLQNSLKACVSSYFKSTVISLFQLNTLHQIIKDPTA